MFSLSAWGGEGGSEGLLSDVPRHLFRLGHLVILELRRGFVGHVDRLPAQRLELALEPCVITMGTLSLSSIAVKMTIHLARSREVKVPMYEMIVRSAPKFSGMYSVSDVTFWNLVILP